jgi:hypothetical protein
MSSKSLPPKLLSFAISISIAATVEAQVARPTFVGRWTLSPQESKAGGGGRGDPSGNATGGGGGGGGGTGLGSPADELTVQQNDTMLIVAARRDAVTDTLWYRLDGKAIRNLMPVARGETVHTSYSSRWNRARLETTISRKVGTRSIRYRELMYLSPDSALVVETDVVGSLGGRTSVYRKAR